MTKKNVPPARPRAKITPPPQPVPPEIPVHLCEADAAEGLEAIAARELRRTFDNRVEVLTQPARLGALQFEYVGNPYHLLKLKTVQAVYLVQRFDIPRPKALLGDQHFKALLAQIAAVRDLSPQDAYRTITINAAGSDSSVMRRLKDELAAKTNLTPSSDDADLLIRLRHPPGQSDGWESLIRLSPRPLATRPWRVCSREGALNAAVAHAMALLTHPKPEDVFLNIACGSGTLLIERLAAGPAQRAVGYDSDESALECARLNVAAAGYGETIQLHRADIRELPLPDGSVDALCADLPFGHLVGSHRDNVALYPAALREAARVARHGARFALISHEIRLVESLLADSRQWAVDEQIRVGLGGLYPRIFVLTRR